MWSSTCAPTAQPESTDLADCYRETRHATEDLCEPLEVEDYVVQSMPDASPVKWHLAHTTWFFETFLLSEFVPDYRPYRQAFGFLFNSYYQAVGPRWPRDRRGQLTRPTVREVFRYRAHVDERMSQLMQSPDFARNAEIGRRVRLGINHEQQHQELILTDLKHLWSANPLRPVYRETCPEDHNGAAPMGWVHCPECVASVGHTGDSFSFDNETPRHKVLLHGFQLATRPVNTGEFLAFVKDDGYDRPEFWLSEGWAVRQARGWTSPLYWQSHGSDWSIVALSGERPLCLTEPVCHVSYYEADAFARWAGDRLPTEEEWETAATGLPVTGHFLEAAHFHPSPLAAADDHGPIRQLYGDVWQWTASPYVGYPGYRPAAGALGEYNGKFMCNQLVLRGASCATPRSHARRTYRNFFPPDARWQFSGIRLAKEYP